MDIYQKLSQILPPDPSRWTISEFQIFLKHIQFEEYAKQFGIFT